MKKHNKPGIILYAVMHYYDDHEKFSAFFLDEPSAELLASVKNGFGNKPGKVVPFLLPINVSVSNMPLSIAEPGTEAAEVKLLNEYHGNLMLGEIIEPVKTIYGNMEDAQSDEKFWDRWGKQEEQMRLYKSGTAKITEKEAEAIRNA